MHNKLNNKPATQSKESNPLQGITKYLAYWPLFVLCFLAAVALAYFYLHYTIPKYEADATIIIKDQKKGSDNNQSVESLDPMNSKKIIENEIEVLQSRSIMNNVVKKLHLYAPVYQHGNIKSISAYQLSPLVIEVMNPDSIVEMKKIDFEYDAKTGVVKLDDLKIALDTWTKTPYGILRFIHNARYKPSDLDKPFYFSLFPPKAVAEGILTSLKVTASSKLSSVIDLTYQDAIPRRAEDILNELIASYVNSALDEKNSLAKNTLSFIEARLSLVSKDLDSIEVKLRKYKSGSGAVDISRQGQIYLDNVSSNDKKLSDLNTQIGVMEVLERNASSIGGVGMLPSSLGVTDPSLTQQMNNLSTLQLKYEQLKGTVPENNPVIQGVVSQINQVKPAILSNIVGLKKNLERSRSELSASGGTFNNMISAIPAKEQQLVEITRDLNIKNGIYSFLLQKREESELTLASSISDSKIVNNAQSSTLPVSPNKMLVIIMALAMAVAFPVALIAGREIFSAKILYRHEIEGLTKIPIIGEISFNKSAEALVVQPGKRTATAEEFRKIRVSLLSLGIGADHKKILVTSSIAGEGKSFISANLATSISLTGKKVVLVDMDLHDPGVGKLFNIKEQPGVSDYLIGKKSIAEIIYNIPGNDNLFYISSGTLQQDASELLENGKVQSLIAKLDADFDMVVIDSAPIVLITDAYLLSSLCDATLYVVMHKVSPKMVIKRIDENSIVNPIKNPAIIFNGVKPRGFFKNNHGYGYNYAYGYGDNKKKKKNQKKRFFNSNNV